MLDAMQCCAQLGEAAADYRWSEPLEHALDDPVDDSISQHLVDDRVQDGVVHAFEWQAEPVRAE